MTMEIGFSQPIELPWLEHAAFLVASRRNREQVRTSLNDLLSGKIATESHSKRSSRSKRISILMQIWVVPPPHAQTFRDGGLSLIRRLPSIEHLPLHYGMTITAYPFFATVSETIGRLLRLQGEFTIQQLQRRVCEALGQRDTVKYAVSRVVRSLVDWGCLKQQKTSGCYTTETIFPIQDPELICWLLEAVLLSRNQKSMPLDQVESSPVLFPFAPVSIREALRHPSNRLSIIRHGLDSELIERIGN